MATVRLISGPSSSEREARINDTLSKAWPRALLIVPTRRHAIARTRKILQTSAHAGFLGEPVTTFQDFVSSLLHGSQADSLLLSPLEQDLLMREAIARAAPRIGEAVSTDTLRSPGFVSHAQRVIGQLKQAAIEPDAFRARIEKRRRPYPLDAVVAEIYEAYQDTLLTSGAYDLQGMYWVAHVECRKGRPRALESIETLLLDNFDDFTSSEFRLVEAIAPYVEELIFGLNYHASATLGDLYAVPLRTAGRISDSFGAITEAHDPETPASTSQYVSQNLFFRDQPKPLVETQDTLRLVECHSEQDEAEYVGRCVKRLMVEEHVSPRAIAVVHRNLSDAAPLLRDVFGEFGIPIAPESGTSLSDSNVASFVLRALEAIETWQREAVVDVLTARWFRPRRATEERLPHAIPALAIKAQVLSGQAQWFSRIEGMKKRMAEETGEEAQWLLEHLPDAAVACESLLEDLEALKAMAGALPRKGTPADFARGIYDLVSDLGVSLALNDLDDADPLSNERAAFDALQEALSTLARHRSDEVSRRDFVALLRRVLSGASYSTKGPPDAVAALSLESIRHLRFDHVFLIGANEEVLPARAAKNAIYPDRQVRELEGLGVSLESAEQRAQKEQLLFHRLFDTSTDQLTVSWHTRSPGGQVRLPSPYIRDVRALLPGLSIERPEREDAPVASRRDCYALARHVPKKSRTTADDTLRAVWSGIDVERARCDASPWGPYDGVVVAADLLEGLHASYGEDHEFSVSRLEDYVECPFHFFMARVLEVREYEEPDEALDAPLRGLMLHAALETFHRGYAGIAIQDIAPEEAREAMRRAGAEAFRNFARFALGTPDGVLAVEERRTQNALRRYLNLAYAEKNAAWRPTHFEASFGTPRGEVKDPLSRPEPFVLDTEAGAVRFSGRMDRVDFDDAGCRIIDYKTSTAPEPKDIRAGRSLQLTIYAQALEELLSPSVDVAEARFVIVGKKKTVEALKKSGNNPEWHDFRETARGAVAKAVTGIRSGRFTITADHESCQYCPSARVCRYERARVERKAGR